MWSWYSKFGANTCSSDGVTASKMNFKMTVPVAINQKFKIAFIDWTLNKAAHNVDVCERVAFIRASTVACCKSNLFVCRRQRWLQLTWAKSSSATPLFSRFSTYTAFKTSDQSPTTTQKSLSHATTKQTYTDITAVNAINEKRHLTGPHRTENFRPIFKTQHR